LILSDDDKVRFWLKAICFKTSVVFCRCRWLFNWEMLYQFNVTVRTPYEANSILGFALRTEDCNLRGDGSLLPIVTWLGRLDELRQHEQIVTGENDAF